ncbi:MAG: hypothetical protein ACTHLU_10215 [Novosphingobium sp.]|jgi:hypothetical protein
MLSLLAASLLTASPAQAQAVDDPDLRCYAAVTLALVGMQESKEADAATLTGLAAIIWYYYGRMEVRLPGVDYAAALAELTSRPGYVTRILPADGQRCGTEAEGKGKEMQEMGKRLQELAPALDHRRS